ncbi:hypothetical protein OOK60_04740 [Trichothermofontia sichuanensis B231]|uniref:hypothetical protein n=1 Tax=Trichothermofontia sichuanensis TaxID=3045816 RepID=UPI002246E9F9|nr:hypothetical protein [Trichothermofontia sichuanensis]UZQ55386.1 hypothetical protein OOK60_04740 [Trichothermofontia sichuanensis B231]
MRPMPPQGRIRPRISTMPRQPSEASFQLDLYKLAVEKKRLEQELRKIEQRRHQIQQRLSLLEKQIASTEEQVQQLREPPPTVSRPIQKIDVDISETYNTLLLEY